jgi:hypothetical protein
VCACLSIVERFLITPILFPNSTVWDHLTRQLVTLADSLLEQKRSDATSLLVAATGRHMLRTMFERQPAVRAQLCGGIAARLLVADAAVSHHIALLADLCTSQPRHVAPHHAALRDAVDSVARLSCARAEALLDALAPLLCSSSSSSSSSSLSREVVALRDAVVLVLRKAMFDRAESARHVACVGFMTLLRHVSIIVVVTFSILKKLVLDYIATNVVVGARHVFGTRAALSARSMRTTTVPSSHTTLHKTTSLDERIARVNIVVVVVVHGCRCSSTANRVGRGGVASPLDATCSLRSVDARWWSATSSRFVCCCCLLSLFSNKLL